MNKFSEYWHKKGVKRIQILQQDNCKDMKRVSFCLNLENDKYDFKQLCVIDHDLIQIFKEAINNFNYASRETT